MTDQLRFKGRASALFIAFFMSFSAGAAVTAPAITLNATYDAGTISIPTSGTVEADGSNTAPPGAGINLTYAEGGTGSTDPCPTGGNCYYVDPTGSDSNNGRSGTPWATLGKVVSSKGSFTAGTHILLKRGETWNENLLLTSMTGTESKPIVIGAYGSGNNPITNVVRVDGSTWVTIRDLDASQIDASYGASYILVYNNIVSRDVNNNSIRFFGLSHHNTVYGNLVYNPAAQDGIVIHDANFGAVNTQTDAGRSYWVVANTVIGDNTAEDLIDHGQGVATKNQGGSCSGIIGDVKIVDNQLQQNVVSGLSNGTGANQFAINSGHCGIGMWIIGNNISGGRNAGYQIIRDDDFRKDYQLSGNVSFMTGQAPKYDVLISGDNVYYEYNTVHRRIGGRGNLFVKKTSDNITVRYNLFSVDRSVTNGGVKDSWVALEESIAQHSFVGSYNHFEDVQGTPDTPFIKDSSGNQTISGTSTTGVVPSISAPVTVLDPRTWTNTIKTSFQPGSGWSRCATPAGAYSCTGVRLGRTMRPFVSSLGGDGYGWRGHKIVQKYIKDQGLINE